MDVGPKVEITIGLMSLLLSYCSSATQIKEMEQGLTRRRTMLSSVAWMSSTAKPFVVVEEKSRWYSLGFRVAYCPNNVQALVEGEDLSVYGAKSITFSFVR